MAASFRIVCANIVEEDGTFLLVQEGKERVRGQWNLPAGTLEPEEGVVERAAQEALEEAGIEVEPDSLVGIYTPERRDDSSRVIHFVFDSERSEGDVSVDGEEILDAGWFTREEIAELDLRGSYIPLAIQDWKQGNRVPLHLLE